MLEVIYNNPINYEALNTLYADRDDLTLAWPEAKFPLCPTEWNDWITAGNQYASLLFKYGSGLVGQVLLRNNDQEQLFLYFVILDKQFRGQGLTHPLLQKVEEFALSHFSNKEIYLHVDPENLPALNAYRKNGYEQIAVTDKGRYRMKKSFLIKEV